MNADIARLARDVPRAQSVLAAARAQADDLVALQRTSARRATSAIRARRSSACSPSAACAPPSSALDVQDGRVRLTFAGRALRRAGRACSTRWRSRGPARASDATLTARVEPGTVRAEFTLAR